MLSVHSPFLSAHRRQFQQDQLLHHYSLSLSLSRRDEVCPVASGRHFPAGRLLPPRSSLQSRRYLYSTHTLCSTPDSNTVSLPLHCTAAITVLSCVALCSLQQILTQCVSTTALYCSYYCIALCALHQTLTQCHSTTALYCSYYCIELCCVALCALQQTLTQCLSTTALYCSYYCIVLCCSLPPQTLSLVWSRVATQWEKMTVFCRYVCMELSVKELQSLI